MELLRLEDKLTVHFSFNKFTEQLQISGNTLVKKCGFILCIWLIYLESVDLRL